MTRQSVTVGFMPKERLGGDEVPYPPDFPRPRVALRCNKS
jgi:hypothetical protein